MIATDDSAWWHFHLFGFTVFRDVLASAVDDLRQACLTRLGADPDPERASDYVVPGQYAPMLDDDTSWSAVVDTCRPIASSLLDAEPLLSPTEVQASLFMSETRWHSDATVPCRGVKLACYLDGEPSAAPTARLRVLPLSHRVDPTPMRSWLRTGSITVADIPATTVTVEPGDLIAFDLNLWHAGIGTRDRLQWSALFFRDPNEDAAEQRAVTAWLNAADEMATKVFSTHRWPGWGLHLLDARAPHDDLAASWHRRLRSLRGPADA